MVPEKALPGLLRAAPPQTFQTPQVFLCGSPR
jgi:hypothetical protein